MDIEIRPYRDADEAEWMRVHAVILSISHAWNYCIQERPSYARPNARLVATVAGQIVGLADVEYDTQPGEICYVKDSLGGYVLEFGRLPEYAGHNIGRLLIDALVADARAQGVGRLEFWSQDRSAQRYYRRMRMKEIGRHYRFRMKPPQAIGETLLTDGIGVEYIYGVCRPEEWPLVKQKYEVLTRHPLEPHLCVGFELRFG